MNHLKINDMIEAYPLQWPLGYKQTKDWQRKESRFSQTPDKVQNYLRGELNRLGTTNTVVSTNIPLRRDGYFYSDMAMAKIKEPGAAVYFRYQGKDIVMCCDQYLTVTENVYAIAKSINAIRDMERWGVSDFLERTFAGFKAIPEKVKRNIKEILLLSANAGSDEVKKAYKEKLFLVHPDKGGRRDDFDELQAAYQEYISENK